MADVTPFTVNTVDGGNNDYSMPAPPPLLTPIDVNASAGFPLQLVAATAGKFTRAYRLYLTADAPTIATFRDGVAALPFTLKFEVAGQTIVLDPNVFPWWQGSTNTAFKLDLSVATQLTGVVYVFTNDA